MELKKGQNMIEHEAEIFSRPARTWFQTGKEKAQAEGASHQLFISARAQRFPRQRSASPNTRPASMRAKKAKRSRRRRSPRYVNCAP